MYDEFLYKYIPAAEKSAMDAIPKEDELNHTFSQKFQRKMKALVNYERRGTFGRAAVRFGRVAAAVLLIVFLLNTVLVVSVDAYREKFFEMIQTVTERFTSIIVDMDDDASVTELVPIQPSYIPEGFEVIESYGDSVQNTVIYTKDAQEIYYCQTVAGSGVFYFDTEDALVDIIQIAGQAAYVITEDNMIQVYWVHNGYEFLIISNVAYDDILAVAGSIMK